LAPGAAEAAPAGGAIGACGSGLGLARRFGAGASGGRQGGTDGVSIGTSGALSGGNSSGVNAGGGAGVSAAGSAGARATGGRLTTGAVWHAVSAPSSTGNIAIVRRRARAPEAWVTEFARR
jgi:hypothetical protein